MGFSTLPHLPTYSLLCMVNIREKSRRGLLKSQQKRRKGKEVEYKQ
jgi:hypothetical protein